MGDGVTLLLRSFTTKFIYVMGKALSGKQTICRQVLFKLYALVFAGELKSLVHI